MGNCGIDYVGNIIRVMSRKKQKSTRKQWRRAFLAALRQTGKVCDAAAAAGVDRTLVYRIRNRNLKFAKAWDDALEEAAGMLEDEAVRRARDGVIKYKFTSKGEPVLHPVTGEPYYELDYSDTLLMFLLKGIYPDKYRDRANVQVEGGETPVKHDYTIRPVDPEALKQFHADIATAGLDDLSDDSGEQPTDTLPPIP